MVEDKRPNLEGEANEVWTPETIEAYYEELTKRQ